MNISPLALTSFLWGFPIVMSMMLGVFLLAKRINNGGIVDVFWGLGFSLLALLYFALTGASFSDWRALVLMLMVLTWSLRLAFYLLLRFRRLFPEEDGRYKAYREAWGSRADLGLFLAFQLQAVLLSFLGLPFAVVLANQSRSAPVFPEIVAIIIFALALAGESLADKQLEDFRRSPENKGQVCQVGLWNYSRHPNYFFEWLIWMAFFLFALPSAGGIYTFYCPVLMYFFLTRVTGVKATEEQTLRTRGDAYRRYQESTSAFFPWFKKAPR